MIYYKLIKITNDALKLAKVNFNVIIGYYSLSNLIVSNKNL